MPVRAIRSINSGYWRADMPLVPSTSSSFMMMVATGRAVARADSSPAWTWRPCLRRLRTELAATSAFAESVDRHVGAPSGRVADRAHRGPSVVGISGDGCGCSHGGRQRQGPMVDVHGHDPGTDGSADHHHAQSEPSAAVNCQPFAGGEPGPLDQCPVGRDHPAAQDRAVPEREVAGQFRQIGVGVGDGAVAGEGAPVGETGLEVVVADLLIPGAALLASAAPATERCDHPVSRRPASGVGSGLGHHSGQFVAGHMRQRHSRIVAMPGEQVAAA